MPNFPVRNLSQYGVLTDPDPYDLPLTAFSFAAQARFRNGKIERGPVYRNVFPLGTVDPRFVVGATLTSGQDFLFIGYKSGQVFRYQSGAETDYSITSYTPNSAEDVWTSCHLADLTYINRGDRAPWYLRLSDANFQNLASAGWDATWTTRLLRSCSNALVALNVTKSGSNFPTMVKTSSFPTAGTVPASWDETIPGTNATENILAEMQGYIVDAQTMGNDMYIYGPNETWLMTFVGGTNVWDYVKRFNKGAINANCSIEINGEHIVFGPDDIWKHDGTTPVSICEGRVREFIYGALNATKASRCFIQHNAVLKELMFCFVSGDEHANFLSAADGCNRAAIWNYETDKWQGFDDLPLVFSGSLANLDTTLTYATVTQTYGTIGGTYIDQEDTFRKSTVFVGDTNAGFSLTKSLYAFDPVGPLSKVSSSVDTYATKDMYIERDGIDLDELGVDLPGYKICQSIYPQGRLEAGASPLNFTVGSADYFNQVPTFNDYQTWDGDTLYKLDYGKAGRYLALRILFQDYKRATLSGYDVDLDVLGER